MKHVRMYEKLIKNTIAKVAPTGPSAQSLFFYNHVGLYFMIASVLSCPHLVSLHLHEISDI